METTPDTTTTSPSVSTVIRDGDTPPLGTRTNRKRQLLRVGGALLLLALLAGGGYCAWKYFAKDTVAIVNGTPITRAEYEESIALITKTASMQGIDLSDPSVKAEIEKQAMSTLVDNALLVGAAVKAGYSASEEKVNTEYETLKTQMGDAATLEARMKELGLTEEKLRKNIRDRIIVDSLIEAETDIETLKVSEEEVKAFIEKVGADGAKLPPLEQIRGEVESQLLLQKQQSVVQAYLEKLRSESEIDIKTGSK